jgi:hypothetical protein
MDSYTIVVFLTPITGYSFSLFHIRVMANNSPAKQSAVVSSIAAALMLVPMLMFWISSSEWS